MSKKIIIILYRLVEQHQEYKRRFADHSYQLMKHEDSLFAVENTVNGYKD